MGHPAYEHLLGNPSGAFLKLPYFMYFLLIIFICFAVKFYHDFKCNYPSILTFSLNTLLEVEPSEFTSSIFYYLPTNTGRFPHHR